MKFPLSADTFPTLALSRDDERALEVAAETIVKQTVLQYHEHLTRHNGVVATKRWKKVKQRDGLCVYRKRSASFSDTASSSSGSSTGSARDPTDSSAVMSMLTFGTVHGDLDDVMYGVLNPSSTTMQLKSAYVGDGFVDWRLLASIIKPSEQNPFRELGIKWSVKSHPHLVGAVVRARDTLYIESIGFALTPNGERIGYHLQHSVSIPEIPELHKLQIVRVKVSFCHLFRQRGADCIEVFIRGVISPMGDAPLGMIAATCAEVFLSVGKNLHCAEMKKLTTILASKQRAMISDSETSSFFSSSNSSNASASAFGSSGSRAPPTSCALCSHRVGGRLAIFSSSKAKHCRICLARVCSRCRLTKSVHVPAAREKELSSTSMIFCTRCVLGATSAQSAKFAVLDALEAEGKIVDYSKALGR